MKYEVIQQAIDHVTTLNVVTGQKQLKEKVIEELQRNGYQTEANAVEQSDDLQEFTVTLG